MVKTNWRLIMRYNSTPAQMFITLWANWYWGRIQMKIYDVFVMCKKTFLESENWFEIRLALKCLKGKWRLSEFEKNKLWYRKPRLSRVWWKLQTFCIKLRDRFLCVRKLKLNERILHEWRHVILVIGEYLKKLHTICIKLIKLMDRLLCNSIRKKLRHFLMHPLHEWKSLEVLILQHFINLTKLLKKT